MSVDVRRGAVDAVVIEYVTLPTVPRARGVAVVPEAVVPWARASVRGGRDARVGKDALVRLDQNGVRARSDAHHATS